MKAISFLGITAYRETTYVHQDKRYTTQFFAECLPSFYPDLERVLVFMTPTVAKHENHTRLKERLGNKMTLVPIAEGRSEGELWDIFDALTAQVADEDKVIFDITNSFRSIPFLVFLAAAYLRSARKVDVKGILYGAWEAKDVDNVSPVFDLTPFVTLLDWLTATDQFVQTGDARRLANLLDTTGKPERVAADAAKAISTVSLAAFLCQPFLLMPEASQLEAKLSAMNVDSSQLPRPYKLLQDQIVKTYSSFGADWSSSQHKGLAAQYRLIRWYYDNNQIIQAVTLAREWLISMITLRLGREIDLKEKERRLFERALSGLAQVGQERRDSETGEKYTVTASDLNEFGRYIFDHWSERKQLADLWNVLSNVRNTLDHAGHQVGAMKMETIQRNVSEKVMPQLKLLAQAWL